MSLNVTVVGGTGAIGAPIVNAFKAEGFRVNVLNSSNFNMALDQLNLDQIGKADALIHCAGTFGGLKQYSTEGLGSQKTYLKNIELVRSYCEKLGIQTLFNISSSSLCNSCNFSIASNYYEYVSHKKEIEKIFENSDIPNVFTLRPSNIISVCERTRTSNHVIAALYKNVHRSKDRVYKVWAHEDDWREFTDANDLAFFVLSSFKKLADAEKSVSRKLIYCSNGQKVLIKEIVEQLSEFVYSGPARQIIFTEPPKPGPVPDLLYRYINDHKYKRFRTDFKTSLKLFCKSQMAINFS